jgi:hypothetical protein
MTKCKQCAWKTDEKLESTAMQELRKHWQQTHPKAYAKVKQDLATYDSESRFCVTCGKSQLSAGYIDTCRACTGWFCPECKPQHARCANRKSAPTKAAA